MRKLPPLNSLRAFEAVARCQSLEKASDELHVTHGALSRHIKQLEQWLNVSLFNRSKRAMVLTPAGQGYAKKISSALDLIHEATLSIGAEKRNHVLGINTTHSIATKWLMHQLSTFSTHSPDIEIWLSLEQGLNAFTSSEVDVAIRSGHKPWSDLISIPIMTDKLITVCSPSLLKQGKRLDSPEQLANFVLLHDQDPNCQWQRWFDKHKINCTDPDAGPRYSSSDVLLHAAMSGQGVALVNQVLAQQELDNGNLIQVFEQSVDLGNYFWLVMPERSRSLDKVQQFCRWLEKRLNIVIEF